MVRPEASDWTDFGGGKAFRKVEDLLCGGMAQCCHDWFTAASEGDGERKAIRALLSRWLGESLQESWAGASMRSSRSLMH
jgi:hypothetical protein